MKLRMCVAALAVGAVITGMPGCAQQRSLAAVRESGENAYTRGDYDGALKDFQEFTDRKPDNSLGHYWLGKTYVALGKPKEGREQLEIAYTSNLEDDRVFDALCDALYHDKKNDELFRMLKQRTMDRGSPADYARLAKYSQLTGDVDGAQAALLMAAKLDGGRTIGRQIALADFYESVHNDEDAVKRLKMALWLDTANGTVIERLRKHGETGDKSTAIKPVERP
jgi:tetratricopeptide (TPR) repeat protein